MEPVAAADNAAVLAAKHLGEGVTPAIFAVDAAELAVGHAEGAGSRRLLQKNGRARFVVGPPALLASSRTA